MSVFDSLKFIKILDGLAPDKDDFISKLIPSIPAFVTQLCSFIVLVVAVVFFAYKPVKKRLDARKKMEDDKIKKAEKNLNLSKKKIKEADELILDSKKKALKIIEEGKNQSKVQGDEILKQAEIDAQNLKDKALKDMEAEKEKMKEELYKETVDISLVTASKLVSKEMDNETNEKLAKEFINDLKKEKNKK